MASSCGHSDRDTRKEMCYFLVSTDLVVFFFPTMLMT